MVMGVKTSELLEELLADCARYYGTDGGNDSVSKDSGKSLRSDSAQTSGGSAAGENLNSSSSKDDACSVLKSARCSEADSFDIFSLDGALQLRRMWNFNLSPEQKIFQNQCWQMFLSWMWEGSLCAECESRDSYLSAMYKRAKDAADMHLYIKSLAEDLSALPLSGFKIRIEDRAFSITEKDYKRSCETSAGSDPLSCQKMFHIIYSAVVGSQKGLPALFGLTDRELKFLKSLDPEKIACLIRSGNIHLVQMMERNCFKKMLELKNMMNRALKADGDSKGRAVQHVRTEAMLLLSSILGSMVDHLNGGIKKGYEQILGDTKEIRLLEIICGELVDLNFDTGFICSVLGVTNKFVIRRRNLSNGGIGVSRREQWKQIREIEPAGKSELMCHRTLFLNALLVVEASYSNWQGGRLLHLRKIIAAFELYLMILKETCPYLAPAEFRELTGFIRELGSMNISDFVYGDECRQKENYHPKQKNSFTYPFTYRSDSFTCCFCRKLCRTPLKIAGITDPGFHSEQEKNTDRNLSLTSEPSSAKTGGASANSSAETSEKSRRKKHTRVGITFGRRAGRNN